MDATRLFLIPILLTLSGFFSSAETALFSLGPNERDHIRKTGGAVSHAIRRLLVRPRAVLVTVLFANLVVNVLYFSVAAHVIDAASSDRVQAVGLTLVALLAVLVVGEIVPKSVALRRPVPVARLVAWPLILAVGALTPVRLALEALLHAAQSLIGTTEQRRVKGRDLREVVGRAMARGDLRKVEGEHLTRILELRDVRVREIMSPRVDLFGAQVEEDSEVLAERVLEQSPEWVVVYGEDLDDPKGFLAARDVLLHRGEPLTTTMREPCFVPETAWLLDLVRECSEKGVPLAIILDEFGGTAGMLTLERVLERVVGELRAEGERRVQDFQPLGGGRVVIRGNLKIRKWNEKTGLELPTRKFETIAGFLSDELGHVPEKGERVVLGDGTELRVLAVEDGRVLRVEVRFANEEPEP